MLASGVCHSDLHVRDGEWIRPTPMAMGHEGAGVVEAVGPGVRSLRVGQPVALSWLVPCGTCRACRAGRPWACPDSPSFRHRLPDGTAALHRTGGGVRGGGALLLRHRDDVRGDRGPGGGGHPAARRASIRRSRRSSGVASRPGWAPRSRPRPSNRDRRVAVIGLGGVGLSCVMGAALAGASRIVAIDRVPAKLDDGARGGRHGRVGRRRRPGRDARGAARPHRRRAGLRVRGDRAAIDGRAGDRVAAAGAAPPSWSG